MDQTLHDGEVKEISLEYLIIFNSNNQKQNTINHQKSKEMYKLQ